MELQILDIQNKYDFDYVLALYLTSFPSCERRTVLDMISLINTNLYFKVYIIYDQNKKVGFISFWTFKDFVFLEHFAIHSKFRNGGYGKKVLQYLISQIQLPIIGEIELPISSEMAARRRSFYERQGFFVWENVEYAQPNFIKGDEAIPMFLISKGNVSKEFIQKTAKDRLLKEVYNDK